MQLSDAERPRILLIEDEYFLAQEMARDLTARGAEIAGFAPTLEKALTLSEREGAFHGAVVDINLRDDKVFPAIPVLQDRNVAIVFVTGYDESIIPEEFRDIPRFSKPANPGEILDALNEQIRSYGKGG